jgi:hypothetical protein
MFFKLLKSDHFVLGLGIGLATPLVLFFLLYLVNLFLFQINIARFFLEFQTHVFISLFGNLLPIRYYFVNLRYDKTGRGVLLITFAIVLIFFAFKDYLFNI